MFHPSKISCFVAPLESILTEKVHIELKLGVKPVHPHDYPVSHTYCQTSKKELDHMVELGLKPCTASEWASLACIIPKKDGQV